MALILNSAFSALFGLLFWIVAARTVSSKDIGLATATLSAATFIMSLSKLGMDQGLIRYLPDLKEKRGFFSAIVVLTLGLSLLMTGIFLLGINFFSPTLAFLVEGWFLPLFLAYIVITSIYSLQNVALISIRRSDLSMIQNIVLGTRIIALLFLSSFGVLGVFSAYGVAFLIALLLGFFILEKYGLSLTTNLDLNSMRKTLRFSLGNYSAGIFMMAPTTIIPLLILNTIGAKEEAYFYMAYSIAALLIVIPNSISTSLFVEGSHNLPLKENVLKSVRLTLLLLIPMLILIVFFGDKILLIFSNEYSQESFEVLRLLALSSIFSVVTSIFSSIKRIQKEIAIVNYINLTLSVLTIGVGYIALLKYGLLGLGYAWFGANLIVCILILALMLFYEKWS